MSEYLHEHTLEEIEKIYDTHGDMTYAEFSKLYKQPDWCMYPDATMPTMGCWGLTYGIIQKIEDCEGCPDVRKEENL